MERAKLIKAVIFDVGGVLHEDYSEYLWKDIKKTLDVSDENFNKYYHPLAAQLHLGVISEKDFWDKFLSDTKSKKQLPQESLFTRQYRKHYKLDQRMFGLVEEIKRQGVKVAILSNTTEPHYKVNLESDLYKPFVTVILSHIEGVAKPNPAIYRMVLKKLGTKPEETVFIDDKEEYLIPANNLGIKTIAFKSYNDLVLKLKKLGLKLDAKT